MPGKPYSKEELADLEDLTPAERRKAFSEHGMKSAEMSGAASGRQSRQDAIDMMLQRRQKARNKPGFEEYARRGAAAQTPKGATPQFRPVSMGDMEKAIRGGY